MAIHSTPASMLKESLPELIEAAKYCVTYKKTDKSWEQFARGGCLGFPGAIILFSIVDSIGSYFRGDKKFKIKIEGKERIINGNSYEHFFILNSKYFGQSLTEEFIKGLYSIFRSPLMHNAIIGKEALMIPGPDKQGRVFYSKKPAGKGKYVISMIDFMRLSKKAIKLFMKDIDSVVPVSRQGKKFR